MDFRHPKGELVSLSNSFRSIFQNVNALRISWLAIFILVLVGTLPSRAGAPEALPSLLERARLVSVAGVTHPERLIDRTISQDGDYWHTELTAAFNDPNGSVVWDLGQEVTLRSAYLQGDNNDNYFLTVSSDNKSYRPLWTAPVVGSPGMRDRSTHDLNEKGRYVRLQVHGGDRAYAMSELRLSSDATADLGSLLVATRGTAVEDQLQDRTVWFGIAAAICIAFARRGQKLVTILALAALPLCVGIWGLGLVLELWPVGAREISLMRATAAAIAGFAVLREALFSRKLAAHSRVILGALSVSAVIATLSFFNMLNPQFWDHRTNHKSVVHNFDMRVYYPVAKYFRELHFDGLYLASVAAYVDDVPATNLDSLNGYEIRDLSTHRMVRVADVHEQINGIRKRFTPERWQQFVEDMRYFRENMGTGDYMGSMHDHGGNATPVWFLIARILFYFTSANNTVLLLGAMLDPLLLGLMFYAIKRTFGWRTMLVGITLFGANDFYMFGTNWVGATLRHDWMAYIGLGVCALATKRWWQAGALLAMASLIRAFPAFTLITLAFPALAWAYEFYKDEERWPTWGDIREAQGPIVQVARAAAITVGSAVALSALFLGASSWPQWWHKVNLLERDPHTNHESLRMFLSFDPMAVPQALFGDDTPLDWGQGLMHNWNAHLPVFGLLIALTIIAIFAAARKRRPYQAAVMGLILVPVVLSPANYYLHAFFLLCLVVVARERSATGKPRIHPVSKRDAWIWAVLLGLCVAQYRTVLVNDLGLHFLMSGTFMLVSYATILALLLHKRRPRQVEVDEEESAAAEA
jgi:hypothetical protein